MFGQSFDITGTKSYAAFVFRSALEGPILLIICGAFLLPIALHDWQTHYWTPLVVGVLLLTVMLRIINRFVIEELANDEEPALVKGNIASQLSYELVKRLRHKRHITAEALLNAAASTDRGKFILDEMGLEKKDILERCKEELSGVQVVEFIKEAQQLMPVFKEKKIDANVILFLFMQQGDLFNQLLNECDISMEDMKHILQWEIFHNRLKVTRDPLFSPNGLVKKFGSLGRSWVQGYTNVFDTLTENISNKIRFQGKLEVVIHKEQIQSTIHVLSRSSQHNVLITGRTGVGKRTFVNNIAYMLRMHEREHNLRFTQVRLLKAQELLSGYDKPDQILLDALKTANKSGKFVLVIENIGLFLQSGDTKMKGILSKFLQEKNIFVVGIADSQDYHSLVKTDSALDSMFEKIPLEDASDEETMGVLMEEYFKLEHQSHVNVTYKALKSIVDLTKRYVTKGGFPGKAVDVLRDAVLAAKNAGQKIVLDGHIREIVSLKAKMNVQKVSTDEKDKLIHLEEQLGECIVGQRYALTALVNTLKRAKLDINEGDRPLGTFLFLGPTGVGKTQTAKALAELYFGSVDSLIRLDMNEYSNDDSIYGIIGSPDPGSGSESFLTQQVQDHPFSVVLLDEIEKADKKVLNLFLQILDEGMLTDSRGAKTDFRNTVIIATSNAGALFIRDFITKNKGADKEQFKKSLIDTIIKEGTFTPEFVNRFDEVILYEPLSQEEAVQVAILMITSIINDLQEKKGISLRLEEDAVRAIAEKGYSVDFGAREMRRTITEVLENYIADYMLNNEVKRGDEIYIRKEDLKV